MEVDVAKLKLSEILDDKPVKVTVELPAKLHRDLVAYGHELARETGGPVTDPIRLIAPMLERFIATDRGFATARRRSEGQAKHRLTSATFPSGSASEQG